VPVIVRV
jgi:hypothetical protein